MAQRILPGLVLALLLASALPAAAVDQADRDAARALVERQMDAFRRDAAAEAFAFASPAIRSIFGTEERFLDMVRSGFPPVYRPRSVVFGEIRKGPEGLEQVVGIQDQQGVDWDAVYSFERQPDGSWLISGCRLVKRPGEAA